MDLLGLWENALKLIGIFLVERYVFLECGMELKRQKRFYFLCAVMIYLTQMGLGSEVAEAFAVFAGGLNISLARKEHQVKSFFLIVPVIGIMNGLVAPIYYIPEVLFGGAHGTLLTWYLCLADGLVTAVMVLFAVRGREWRRQFREEVVHRRLQKWESILLRFVGVLILFCLMGFKPAIHNGGNVPKQLQLNIFLLGVMTFALTLTVMILIMQGNKRFYYYDQVLNMQKVEFEKEKAEASNRAKTVFLSNMSHEIRTPMNTIVGMTDILLREEQTKQTREYLNSIKNSGEALLTIINDILDFSKIESGKMEIIEEEYEPMSMFHDLAMMFINRIGDKKVELLYDIDPDMPVKLYGDDQRIRQIVINLVNNAIKFTENGYVKLSVRMQESDEGNAKLTFRVEDTGQGIKEENREKLFESFEQVDTRKNHNIEGTGLGLAISKQLVELMGGSIDYTSTYGEGSCFFFTISQRIVDTRPAARIKEEAAQSVIGIKVANEYLKSSILQLAAAYRVECIDFETEAEKTDNTVDFIITDCKSIVSDAERTRLAPDTGRLCHLQNPMIGACSDKAAIVVNKPIYSLNFCQLLNHEETSYNSAFKGEKHFVAPQARILIVDDNVMNLKVAKGLLAPFRMQIDTAEDGKDALSKVKQKQYDIVFMDHMMPIMDGIEATREIRKLPEERYRTLPIVALSANATSEAREMFMCEGMSDFVSKPIKTKQLVKCILKWLPEELVTEEEQPEHVTEMKEAGIEETEAEALPVIEGLNVAEGIRNCGSKELFLELLGDFYKLIDQKSTKLEKCLADSMLKDYTIEVHALKNTARMIGAIDLSQMFYEMEQLGNQGEMEQIEEHTPELLELYRSYKEILAEYAKASQEEKAQVPLETMLETLKGLHDAMDTFDLDEADRRMRELETYAFPEKLQPQVEELSAYVADVAMENVMRITEELSAKLQEIQDGGETAGVQADGNETSEVRADDGETSGIQTDGGEIFGTQTDSVGAEHSLPRIMLVDDDEINRKAVTVMLREEYEIIPAASGREALTLLQREIPALILLDVHMPDMDGHDVIHRLKENPDYADIPIIFLTSDADESTEIKGFSEGAIDFIRKPFRKDVAIQRIRRILELSYLQNHLKQEVEKQTDVAEKRRQSVERMSMQMVQALVNTIDAKDSYTNGHSTRVAKYAVMLAERLGYSGEKLEHLQYTALLHDIGKIGVPKEIINKPTRLTDEEYEIIKTHPVIGSKILQEISEIPDIAIGARWHHERFDGKGYPDGLQGYEIPETARIIGVADAYDAMTSNRSYRNYLPQEKVRDEIEKGKGTQFDPQIAELMLELIRGDKDYTMHE